MKDSVTTEIDSIRDQLVTRYGAERVVLFGSAVHDPQAANDLDFLVIKSTVPQGARERMRDVRRVVEKNGR